MLFVSVRSIGHFFSCAKTVAVSTSVYFLPFASMAVVFLSSVVEPPPDPPPSGTSSISLFDKKLYIFHL